MNISIHDFFKPVHLDHKPSAKDYETINHYIHFAETLSLLSYQSIYFIDYFRRGFLYVSDNPLFLCGKTPQQVLKSGFSFHLDHVPEEDLQLLLEINEAGFAFYNKIKTGDRMDYLISYDFRLRQPNGHLMLINHKLTPLILDSGGIYSLKRGDGFLTSGLTFANAELGSSFVQYSSYSYAEKVFLSWSLPGLTALEKANIIMGVSTISLGAQSELFDYAVRTSFKSANSWYAYNQLRGTQKAWRQMAILGKDGATLRNGMNVLGKGVFAIQATVSGYSAISALASNDANKWGVTGKAALDITSAGATTLPASI